MQGLSHSQALQQNWTGVKHSNNNKYTLNNPGNTYMSADWKWRPTQVGKLISSDWWRTNFKVEAMPGQETQVQWGEWAEFWVWAQAKLPPLLIAETSMWE